MYDVITFGSATQDIYLKSDRFRPVGKDICLPAATKMKMDGIAFSTGGGGTNTAATFAMQGLRTAYCGMVSNDYFGDSAVAELKKLKIGTAFIQRTNRRPTNISIILSQPDGEKTILVYRGAADLLSKKDIPWAKIKTARWFYLSPFAEKMADLTEEVIDFAKKNEIKVAFSPGYDQLNMPKIILERILGKVDVLVLNKEEAARLTGISSQNEKEIFQEMDRMVKGIVVLTKGKEGVVVSDGKYIYQAPALELKVFDTTGAGDSFGSGFVAGLIQKGNIEYAIQLAMANSGYNIASWGAKAGLLRKGQKFEKVKILKYES